MLKVIWSNQYEHCRETFMRHQFKPQLRRNLDSLISLAKALYMTFPAVRSDKDSSENEAFRWLKVNQKAHLHLM